MNNRHSLAATCEQMLREQLPNLFRLYLNPWVAQTCFCLERYVRITWDVPAGGAYQTFLANGFDEALSGAIKLARYCAATAGRPPRGLIIDPADRLGPFAAVTLGGGERVEFLPGLVVVRSADQLPAGPFGFVVLAGEQDATAGELPSLLQRERPLVIACVDRARLTALRHGTARRQPAPDIVVFDESFVDHDVPFAAFTARRALYDHWNRRGKTTFHSTTYQPNTISTLHFMNCLAKHDPEFHAGIGDELRQIAADLRVRARAFGTLYSPSLLKATRLAGCATADIRAAGHFVWINGRQVFDAVSGVACSVRGHNPATYAEEIAALAAEDAPAALAARLHELTGLDGMLPAVSGASAVESALKIALVAQFPKRHVLALRSGYGGKTLFALTGTANASYKERIGPLYDHVTYVDPFAPDALAQIEAVLACQPVAVVQLELIQGVGGVRRVPEAVVSFLAESRPRWGYLLLIDEVQTGMFRTGPFTLSGALGLRPDLLVIGKGVSDMMFPFALTLCSAALREKLAQVGSDLPAALRRRHGYEFGYRTALNVLRRADELDLPARVAAASEHFAQRLSAELSSCRAVREVRVHGLLIGVELAAHRWPQRWLRKRLFWFYLSAMLRHHRYPVLVGFCQYEPNVLKVTPPLTTTPAEIAQACATIGEVLRRPFHRLAAAAAGALLRPSPAGRKTDEHPHFSAHEPVAH